MDKLVDELAKEERTMEKILGVNLFHSEKRLILRQRKTAFYHY
jgi:hypothetical protein